MKLKQHITSRGIRIDHPERNEWFLISEVEDSQFGVTSNTGIDSFANGLTFNDIRKAFKYIEVHIKNN